MTRSTIVFFLFIFIDYLSFGQLVFNGGAIINVDGGTSSNPIYVVLTQTNSSPVITNSVGSGFMINDEYNKLQYNLGASTQSIVVPYLSKEIEQMPLALAINTAGIGNGNVRFSSRVAPIKLSGFNNALYMPSGVSGMPSGTITNNSSKTLDRFWIIDANSYTNKPAVTLQFDYLEDEFAANDGNTITEANLQAQRYNSTLGIWGDYYPRGVINTASNLLSNVVVASEDFFAVWVLNDNIQVLEVDLLSFQGLHSDNCNSLEWITITEHNFDYFIIEKSTDGENWTELKKIQASGNSHNKNVYSINDCESIRETIYYRLKQVDRNGSFKYSSVIDVSKNKNSEFRVSVFPNPANEFLNLHITSPAENQFSDIKIINSLGQTVIQNTLQENDKTINVSSLEEGIYYLSIINSQFYKTVKFVKQAN